MDALAALNVAGLYAALLSLAYFYWSWIGIREAGEKAKVLSSVEAHDDPSLRLVVLANVFYHAGVALLGLVFGAALVVFRDELGRSTLFLILATLPALTVPIFGRFFQRAARGDVNLDSSMLLSLAQTVGYTLEQQRQRRGSESARARVNPIYLENPDVFVRVIRPAVRYLKKLYGNDRARSILEEMGMPMEYLDYHDNPLNLRFAMDLLSRLRELTGDERAAFYAQACGGNLESMGAVFFLISRYCSLKRCYEIFIKATNRFDKVMRYEIVELTRNSMILRIIPKDFDAVKDMPPDGLYSSQGWCAALPNIKGLPHALITEHCSIYRWPAGSERPRYCQFEVRWVNSLDDGVQLQRPTAVNAERSLIK